MSKLTVKGESFAKAYVTCGGNLIQAYRTSDYSQKLTPKQMTVQAIKLSKTPSICLAISELQDEASNIASESFRLSVTQRLKWLQQIVEVGLSTNDNGRPSNLSAARSAIETMNAMLGVEDNSGKVKPVKVFVGVTDGTQEHTK